MQNAAGIHCSDEIRHLGLKHSGKAAEIDQLVFAAGCLTDAHKWTDANCSLCQIKRSILLRDAWITADGDAPGHAALRAAGPARDLVPSRAAACDRRKAAPRQLAETVKRMDAKIDGNPASRQLLCHKPYWAVWRKIFAG